MCIRDRSEPEPEPAAHGGRALVAVFSYSGNTFSVAERCV